MPSGFPWLGAGLLRLETGSLGVWLGSLQDLGCGRATVNLPLFIFKKYFIYLFFGEGEESGKEGERNIDTQETYPAFASHTPPTRDLAPQPRHVP